MAIALGSFPGRRLLLAAANTGMGLPPVVVGLVVTVLLWRSGPLGSLGLLYTPTAMVVAQAVIATPVVVALVAAAVQQVDREFLVQMPGGTSAGQTRVLPTAAVLATSRGEFGLAIAFGLVLLLLAFAVNVVVTLAGQR